MKPDLFSRFLSDTDADAEWLDAWLAERDADLSLRSLSDDPLPFTVDAERLAAATAPFDGTVEPGQIRILSPEFVSGDGAIPYVAVLDRWMEDMWLVAPFSPYSTPATPGEMASGVRFAGRRVLQCWNARTAHESLVAQSRVVGILGESVRKDALALFRHVASGIALPDSFKVLVGPPVLSKADPRRKYLAESAARYAPLTAAARALEAELALAERLAAFKESIASRFRAARERVKVFVDSIRIPVYGTPAYALSAADKPRQTIETFRIPSHGVELDVKHTPSEGKVRLVVYKNGEVDVASLEGVVVADKEMAPIGEISNGVLVAEEAALKSGFLLVDPATMEPITLEPAASEER